MCSTFMTGTRRGKRPVGNFFADELDGLPRRPRHTQSLLELFAADHPEAQQEALRQTSGVVDHRRNMFSSILEENSGS